MERLGDENNENILVQTRDENISTSSQEHACSCRDLPDHLCSNFNKSVSRSCNNALIELPLDSVQANGELKRLRKLVKDKDRVIQLMEKSHLSSQGQVESLERELLRLRYREKESKRQLSSSETEARLYQAALRRVNDKLSHVSKYQESKVRRSKLERQEILEELESLESRFETEYLELHEEKAQFQVLYDESVRKCQGKSSTL